MKTMASHYETSAGVGRAAGGGRNCYLTKKLKIKLYGTPVNLKARKCGIIPIFAPPLPTLRGRGKIFPEGGLNLGHQGLCPPPELVQRWATPPLGCPAGGETLGGAAHAHP